MNTKENNVLFMGNLMALGSTIMWAGNFIAAKVLANAYTGLEMSFWRWIIASILLLPLSYKHLKKDFPLIKQEWKLLLLYGFLGCFLSNFLFYNAPQTAPAVDMTILMTTSPLFMMILSWLIFKEKINTLWIIGSLLCLGGVFVLVTKGNMDIFHHFNFTIGHFWTLGCSICFALYSVSMRFFKVKIHLTVFLQVTFTIACFFAVLLTFFYYGTYPPIEKIEHIWALLYIGGFASIFAFLCWNTAIEMIGAVRAGIIYYLVPVFGSTFAVIFVHEQIGFIQLLGGIMVLTGVLTCTIFKNKQ